MFLRSLNSDVQALQMLYNGKNSQRRIYPKWMMAVFTKCVHKGRYYAKGLIWLASFVVITTKTGYSVIAPLHMEETEGLGSLVHCSRSNCEGLKWQSQNSPLRLSAKHHHQSRSGGYLCQTAGNAGTPEAWLHLIRIECWCEASLEPCSCHFCLHEGSRLMFKLVSYHKEWTWALDDPVKPR